MRNNTRLAMALLPLLLVLTAALSLATGSYEIGWGEILQALTGQETARSEVILNLRLPRVLLSLFTGANLTLGGIYMQALLRNPLADPYIMGLTAGAGLGVNLVILGIIPLTAFTLLTYPTFASLGAIASLLLVLGLGFRSLSRQDERLIIAGVAVSSICTALTGLLIYLFAQDDQVRQVVFWSFGNFNKADTGAALVSGLLLLISLAGGWLLGPRLDVLALGDFEAQSLGMPVQRIKLLLLLLTSVCVGGNVAFSGPVGFVGMMIPHVSRALFSEKHRIQILPAALLGGTFLCACDLLSRWISPPAGIPIGIVTALLGVPFFMFLLWRERR
ncbi:MAG: iron ABC transporter permease [Bacteroidetes bacterium]|nr:MAG: iron ABC transporter permease [Bacteroidota bacterium]